MTVPETAEPVRSLNISEDFFQGDIRKGLEKMRLRLLDLTARNRLLNFRHTKKGALRVIDELPDQLFSSLLDGKELRFQAVSRPRGLPEPAEDEEDLKPQGAAADPAASGNSTKRPAFKYPTAKETAEAAGIATSFELPLPPRSGEAAARHTDREIQTLHYPEELEAILRSISSAARLAIEETGTNMLFLVAGFLEWYESEDSKQPRLAPLLLLPVSISRQAADSATGTFRYSVRYSSEDIQANISLQERLRRDFAIDLPDVEDGQTPEAYFRKLRTILVAHPTWKLHRWVSLTLLSFGKLLMYRDLDPGTWPERATPADHERIREFFQGIQRTEHSFAIEHALDDPAMQSRVPAIVDNADSSQHSALVDAMDGKNLVIEGPPGTGKSQTIANLIAAALSKGKSILFVSEKLAALEVVRHRLDRVGLGHFCLELHSHKTQKRLLLDDVASRLERFGKFPSPLAVEERQKILERDRKALTDYAELVNKPFGRIGRPLHDTIWRAQRTRSALKCNPDLLDRVVLENVKELGVDDIDDRRQSVARYAVQLAEVVEVAGGFSLHPWRGLTNSSLTFVDVQRVADLAEEAHAATIDLIALVARVNSELLGPALLAIPDALDGFFKCIAGLPENADGLLDVLLPKLRDPEVRRDLVGFVSLVERYTALRIALERVAPGAVPLSVDSRVAAARLLDEAGKVAPRAATVGALEDASTTCAGAAALIDKCLRILSYAGRAIGLPLPQSMDGTTRWNVALECINGLALGDAKYRHPALLDPDAGDVLRRANAEAGALRAERARLGADLDLSLAPPIAELKAHVSVVADSGWWSMLLSPYRRARKALRAMRRKEGQFTRADMLRDLRAVLHYLERLTKLEGDESIRRVGGSYFLGIDTPFEVLSRLVEWRETLGVSLRRWGEDGRQLAAAVWETSADSIGDIQWKSTEEQWRADMEALEGAIRRASESVGPATGVGKEEVLAKHSTDFRFTSATAAALQKQLNALPVPSTLASADAGEFLQVQSELWSVTRQIDASVSVARTLGHYFAGSNTDTDIISRSLDFYRGVVSATPPVVLLEWLLASPAADRLERAFAIGEEIAGALTRFRSSWSRLDQVAVLQPESWYGSDGLTLPTARLEVTTERLRRAADNTGALPGWLDYLRAREELATLGLSTLVRVAESGVLQPSDVPCAFDFIAAQSLVQAAFSDHPDLTRFSGLSHEKVRERFAQTDKELMELARVHVASIADRRNVPMGIGWGAVSSYTDLHLLEREIEKQKRNIPIRQLIRRAGGALQGLKPCFMMGPLSVAQYLPPGGLSFDLLVMDEASQLRPEDALGAIARAKQVVVVGDRMQLPPTSFFDRLEDEEADADDESEAAAEAVAQSESILDIASAVYKPSRMLRWHYRSRHASLIAYSNKEFYDCRLIAFPSPHAKSPTLGVKFVHVRDGRYENRRNIIEAKRVVATALRHMRQRPFESLGIVTLNSVQRDLVESILEQQLKSDLEAQRYIEDRSHGLEPFFIKNLENVQGDERDVIYISVTYGPGATGKVFQRFGPINGVMGHRRLNVLFTRARLRVAVFSSMLPEDIVAGPESAWGARALRGYLKYAQTGILEQATPSGRDPDSEFEVEVAEALRQRGYTTVAQVGVAGYFVDLAVVHPHRPDTFVLGIECDGKTYHSSVTARDRDRLRQSILEDLGWTIHRVWSTDWFKAGQREVARLVARIEHQLRSENLWSEATSSIAEDWIPDAVQSSPADTVDASSSTWVGEVESQPFSKDEVRALLETVRDEIQREFSSSDQSASLLREEMLECLLREKPRTRDEWLRKVPLELRLDTDGEQLQVYLPRVLETLAKLHR
jgi:very-short-patch-repair endonuclease/preprotein translocase subunit Sec61beta